MNVTPWGYVEGDDWREIANLDDAERRRLLAEAFEAGTFDGEQDDVCDPDSFLGDIAAWAGVHFEHALNDPFTEAMRLSYRSGYRSGRR